MYQTSESSNIVAGYQITTIIDAGGRVVSSTSRPMTLQELAPLFAQAERRGLDLKTGSEVQRAETRPNAEPASTNGAQDHRRDHRPSERAVDQVSQDEWNRNQLEEAHRFGCDTRRIKELMAEFPPRRVARAIAFLGTLLEKNEVVKDPTALVVSQVLRWSKVTK